MQIAIDCTRAEEMWLYRNRVSRTISRNLVHYFLRMHPRMHMYEGCSANGDDHKPHALRKEAPEIFTVITQYFLLPDEIDLYHVEKSEYTFEVVAS